MPHAPKQQLHMVWSGRTGALALRPGLPTGYLLRSYRDGDEAGFFRIMESAGWPGWDDERLRPWVARLLPGGWFILVEEASDTIVASAMALRDCAEFGSQGGELGWLACDSAHTGRGLGLVVSAAVTRRFLVEGYRWIHLYTEDFRLAALKTYLKLGYRPLLETPDMANRWKRICRHLHWPYAPDRWALPPAAS